MHLDTREMGSLPERGAASLPLCFRSYWSDEVFDKGVLLLKGEVGSQG